MRMGWGVLGLGLLIVLISPLPALVLGALLDQGPTEPGITAFYLCVGLSDPLVRESAWNSMPIAMIVAIVSLVLGIAIARVLADWRFWGRNLLSSLLWSPLVVPPMFAAIGLVVVAPRIESAWPMTGSILKSSW